MTASGRLTVGCVLLSMGDRPGELVRAIESVSAQRDVEAEIIVVGNGWTPSGLPDGVRAIALADNVGVPEGRNIGAAAVTGQLLLFLDDDACLVGTDFLAAAVNQFAADPRLGVVQPRSVDPDGAATAVRHVPRLRGRGPGRSGDVAWFWEGCSLVRRRAFESVGGWPGAFFYGHEGIELAWRLTDRGYRIRYDAELAVLNPAADPFRGERHRYLDGRNRVWVARRNLPVPFAVAYVTIWFVASLLRADAPARRATIAGFRAGLREPAGERRPIRWRTCLRLTRLGRPPVV